MLLYDFKQNPVLVDKF